MIPMLQYGEYGLFILFVLILLFILYYLVLSPRRASRRLDITPVLKMEVECPKCGYTEVRPLERGAYVGMKVGTCSKCGGDIIVSLIYCEKLPYRKWRRI